MRTIYRMLFLFILVASFSYADSMTTNFYQSYINSKIDTRNINKPLPVLKKRVIPEYVTAWPKKVEVLKPDPILGDKDVWEYWIYNEEFAKRFEGFDIDKADDELKDSPIKAITLRIYKDNLLKGSSPDYIKQYTCNINVFFDNSIQIPITSKKLPEQFYDAVAYPDNITSGYANLKPIDKEDKILYKNRQPVDVYKNASSLLLVEPLDGRFNALTTRAYVPEFIKGMSVINFSSLGGGYCEIVAPLKKDGILWLSLFGKNPYFNNKITADSKIAFRGGFEDNITKTFPANFDFEANGFMKLPKAFYNIALDKAVLIKNLNSCLDRKYGYEQNKHKKRSEYVEKEMSKKRELYFSFCKEVELTGKIFDSIDIENAIKKDSFYGIRF